MKKILVFIATFALLAACSSSEDTVWENYAGWRETNIKWLEEQSMRLNADGTPYYQRIVPDWNPSAYVLIHYFNDRSQTQHNLSPMYTSTVAVNYKGYLCNDEPFDSSAYPVAAQFPLKNTITGWIIALETMHVGDTAEVLVPYECAYGANASGKIQPYSALRFNLRLTDVPKYEIR